MKIVVLAGGLSTERNVALTSGTGICRALRRRGHKAVLVDMFFGLEDVDANTGEHRIPKDTIPFEMVFHEQ